jgi:hypothetical protein
MNYRQVLTGEALMPDKEKVAPKKGVSKKEPKKPSRRKPKKSADEQVTEQTGKDDSPETKEVAEPDVLQPDTPAETQESPVDSTPNIPPAIVTQPDFLSCGDEFIDEAVKFINEKANEALYKGSIEVGAYILKNFFDDNIKLATSRDPRKSVSYSKLCWHRELTVKPETLGVMVRVASQEKFFAEENVNTDGLSYSHRAELVKLDNDQEKIELVGRILEEGWSVRRVRDVVYALRRKSIDDKPKSEVRLIGDYVSHFVYSRPQFFDDRGEVLFQDQSKRKTLLKLLRGKTRQHLLEYVDRAFGEAEERMQLCQELKRDLEEIKDEEERKTKKS